jgi:hypothetical protein
MSLLKSLGMAKGLLFLRFDSAIPLQIVPGK